MRTYFRLSLVLLAITVAVDSANARELTAVREKLLELAKSHFGPNGSRAEWQLFEAAADGGEADCTEFPVEDRVIRSDRLSWLCTDPEASKLVCYRGISIVGAEIRGSVDLTAAKILFPLSTRECTFHDTIVLQNSHVSTIYLQKTKIKDLQASGMVAEGSIFLRDHFIAQGGIGFQGATIGGMLDCSDGEFVSQNGKESLSLDGAAINGGVYLCKGFKSHGTVNLTAAKIGGNFDCIAGEFVSQADGASLDLHGAKIEGTVYLCDGFKSQGKVNLNTAKINGSLDCAGGQFISPDSVFALDASDCTIQGYVGLESDFQTGKNFRAEGGVRLNRAVIGGDIDCVGGYFVGKGDVPAFSANGAKIDGNVYFRMKTTIEGSVSFSHVSVGRKFEWRDVKLPEREALDLQFTKVGTMYIDPHSWPSRGYLSIDGFDYDRIEQESSANAKTQLDWLQRQLPTQFFPQPYERLASVLRNMGLEEEEKKIMIAKNQDQARHTPLTVETVTDWLWLRAFGPLIGYGYRPMRALWISLAVIIIGSLFFKTGFNCGVVTPTEDTAYVTQKYGKPQLSVLYPKYNAFVYSLETFIPLLRLGVSESWIPNANQKGSVQLGRIVLPISGSFLRIYLWFHIIAGWILTTLWVGGLTGLVKS